jgi:hypothetical protein
MWVLQVKENPVNKAELEEAERMAQATHENILHGKPLATQKDVVVRTCVRWLVCIGLPAAGDPLRRVSAHRRAQRQGVLLLAGRDRSAAGKPISVPAISPICCVQLIYAVQYLGVQQNHFWQIVLPGVSTIRKWVSPTRHTNLCDVYSGVVPVSL